MGIFQACIACLAGQYTDPRLQRVLIRTRTRPPSLSAQVGSAVACGVRPGNLSHEPDLQECLGSEGPLSQLQHRELYVLWGHPDSTRQPRYQRGEWMLQAVTRGVSLIKERRGIIAICAV